MLTIKSQANDYMVEEFNGLGAELSSITNLERECYLADRRFSELYRAALELTVPPERSVYLEASEEQKSFDALTPVFLEVLKRGLKRDGVLVVGGGVLQDNGSIAS